MTAKVGYLVPLVLSLAAGVAMAGKVQQQQKQQKQPVQGPVDIRSDELLVLQQQSKAVFSGNVCVEQGALKITCSKLEVFYTGGGSRRDDTDVDRMVFSGKVLIELDKRRGHCEQAVYQRRAGRIVCTGQPWVEEERSRIRGEVIEYLLKSKEVKVTRPRAVIHLPEEKQPRGSAADEKR